jgi:hypothetical protein
MLPLGDFSLLIASESIGLTQIDLVGVASVGVLITSVVCSIALNRSEHIYVWLKSHLPAKFMGALKDSSGYFLNVLSSFEPEGYFHKLFMNEVRNGVADILYILGASVFYFAGRNYLQFPLTVSGYTFMAEFGLLVILTLLSLIPLAKLAISVKRLFDALALIFSRTTPTSSKGSILRNVVIGAILLVLFANSYLIVDFLLLPRVFNWISVIFGLLSVFFFWSAVRASTLWLFLSKRQPADILTQKIVASEDDMIVVGGGHSEKPEEEKKEGRPSKKRKVIFLR